jgi:hypothetical protein
MMKVGIFFVMASVALFLENDFIFCDCKNILDVPAEAISMAVMLIIYVRNKKNQLEFISHITTIKIFLGLVTLKKKIV